MSLPWYLSVAGLYLSTTAAWFMYRYPMSATRVADTGAAELSAELKRHERCSRLGLGLLGAGFFLQLLGVMLSAWG